MSDTIELKATQTSINTKNKIIIDGENVDINDIYSIALENKICEISDISRKKIIKSRKKLEETVENNIPIYGITTGYGEMVYVLVDKSKETELQTNLVRSHCAGVGPHFSKSESKAFLVARINAFCKGHSGVSEKLVDRLVHYLNNDIIPVIPEIGSLGASGDLGPLSHIAATIIGEGYVFDKNNNPTPTLPFLNERGISPLSLKFKEGLGMINGTSAMTGLGSLILRDAFIQVKQAEIIACLALENQRASSSPFMPEGHEIARPHQGQIDCAKNIRTLITNSQLIEPHHSLRKQLSEAKNDSVSSTNVYIQKAYTLRCIPQMVGAIRDILYHTHKVLKIEINSANDNPLFFDNEEVFHGGNFHGQPVAFAMDHLSIGLVQLGVISERRTNRLLNRYLSNGLPEFLVSTSPGLSCGFAGAQYPATALVAENRTICTPASIQSVPSNGDNQDVVSMGLIAARNSKRILNNNYYILAIELMSALQAIDINKQYDLLSPAAKISYDAVRKHIPMLKEDRYMSDDIEKAASILKEGILSKELENAGINLI